MPVPEDAVTQLGAAYRAIAATRMHGLALCNPRLEVETIGFRDWEGRQVGVLVTPWFMNLVLLPGCDDDWSGRAQGAKSEWHFPGETVELTVAQVEDTGVHLSAPLFSTVQDFPDQDTARALAHDILARLLEPERFAQDAPEVKYSRRDLLRGLLRG